jgi:hypothetical protein
MDENPYRAPEGHQATKRPARFWRSTGFALIAILGWELALQLYRINFASPGERLSDTFITNASGRMLFSWNSYWERPAIVWPVLALVVFFAGKAAWAMHERQRERS